MRHEWDDLDEILTSAKNKGILSRKEEVVLFHKIRAGDIDARNELVERNMLFVKKVVNRYKRMGITIPANDLFQEGCIGLIEAAEKFDADLGNKFVSFAVWYVRKNILDYIRKSKTSFKVSQNLAARKKTIDIFREKYHEEHGRIPTDDVVARQLGIELSEVLAADQHMLDMVSLDSLVGKGDADDSLYSFLPANDVDFENEYLEHDEREQVIGNAIKILGDLYPRNTQIACQYFGIGDFSETAILEDVAKVHGLTRARVSKICERWKLRLSHLIKYGKLPGSKRGAKKTKAKKTKRKNVI